MRKIRATAPNQDRLAAFSKLDLLPSNHKPPEDEENCHACIMEARAWVYRVDWTDHPDFDSPGITSFLIALNDNWPDKDRQRLKKYLGIPPTKASVEIERTRADMCLDWFLREHRALWLDAAGIAGQAAELRALPSVTESNVEAALVTQKKALEDARDARAARDDWDARDAWDAGAAWDAWAARDARAAWAARDAWAAWDAWDAWAAWDAGAAWDAWAARDARAAWAAVTFLIAARAGDALGKDATEKQRIDAGIAALDAITAKTRDAELVLLDRMLALMIDATDALEKSCAALEAQLAQREVEVANLRAALEAAARSLAVLSRFGTRNEADLASNMTDLIHVRGYAANRARVARAALANRPEPA